MLIQMEEHSISDCSNDGTFEDVHMEDDEFG